MEKANWPVKVLSSCADFCAIVASWMMETIAFVLLPLIVYLIVFFALGIEISELVRLPELMFVAIILFADATRQLVLFYRQFRGFSQRVMFTIPFGLLGIVISAMFLAFSMIAQQKPDFGLPWLFYKFQVGIFLWSLLTSGLSSIWITWKRGEGKPRTLLILQNETQDSNGTL